MESHYLGQLQPKASPLHFTGDARRTVLNSPVHPRQARILPATHVGGLSSYGFPTHTYTPRTTHFQPHFHTHHAPVIPSPARAPRPSHGVPGHSDGEAAEQVRHLREDDLGPGDVCDVELPGDGALRTDEPRPRPGCTQIAESQIFVAVLLDSDHVLRWLVDFRYS